MTNVSELKTIGGLVHAIMTDRPETRSSDSLLYYNVLEVFGKRNGINIENMSIQSFFLEMNGAFPNYETVRRTRQKMQEMHPELASAERVQRFRKYNEAAFCDYARGEGE